MSGETVDSSSSKARPDFADRYASDLAFAELIDAAPDMAGTVRIATDYGLTIDEHILRDVVSGNIETPGESSPNAVTNVETHSTELRY